MPGAFYRNTSSSAKKNSERERRQNSSEGFDEAFETSAGVPVSEVASGKRGRADQAEGECRGERSLLAWSVTVTPSALVTMCVLGVALLGFTFLSGVIVGRGTMPLPQVLELETLALEKKDALAEAEEKILTEEELRFMTSLKAREAEGVLSAAAADKAAKKAERLEKARAAEKRALPKKERKEAPKPGGPEASATRFDYEVRVATFFDPEGARRLGERLRKAGMKTRYTQSARGDRKLHYVAVLLRGTVEDHQALRARLAGMGLRDSMVISKVAVAEKPSKAVKKR
ncbi:MAG: SPOR domain-containing protein [Mailhella sp.]|nr:SPOR domain-containing protein [Mailhella sp.]